MLVEQLRKQWRAHEAATPIDAAMRFAPEGLVLGAGTVLAKSPQAGTPSTPDSENDMSRLSALLCAAYLRPVESVALGHVRHALRHWQAGSEFISSSWIYESKLNASL